MERQVKVYWVVIGWLVWTAILMATTILCTSPSAVQYVGFAATVTSLILGVVAILYSFYSNEQSSKNVGSLSEASNKIIEGSDKISGISESIDSSVKVLTEITSKLNQNLEKFPDHLKGLKEDLDNIISQNINISDSNKNKGVELNENFVPNLLDRSTFAALIGLYALSKAFEKGVTLNLEDLSRAVYPTSEISLHFYFGGYILGLRAVRLIEAHLTENGTLLTINEVDENIIKGVDDAINRFAVKKPAHIGRINLLKDFVSNL